MKFADNSIVSNPGSAIHVLYGPKVTKNGEFELVEIGEENIHDYIQSQKELTDMSYILSRMAAGDTSVLAGEGMYGDFTTMPDTLAGMLQLQLDSNRLFDSLPFDVREKFDFDQNKFFAQSGTEDWFKKISSVLSDDVKNKIFPIKEEVSESVVKEE